MLPVNGVDHLVVKVIGTLFMKVARCLKMRIIMMRITDVFPTQVISHSCLETAVA